MEIELEEFFDFSSKKPINRLAYTDEDIEYKVQIIRRMQELGMSVFIDKIGNICGKLQVGGGNGKTLAIGSHTDSVYDGGQYDGPVGVITGLKVAENLAGKKGFNGTVLVTIYSCEESSRFGNACLGSKFLNGDITEEDFGNILDQKALADGQTITLADAVKYAKEQIKSKVPDIEDVDKVFSEVDYSLESHIEQYEILDKKEKKKREPFMGIITSIGSAVRVKYIVNGQANHTGSTPMKKRKNAVDAASKIGIRVRKLGKQYEKDGMGRASQVEINTPNHNGSFNQIPDEAEGCIDFRLLGENTPEKVLKDFDQIVEKVKRKFKTQIQITIVSKGKPVITDSTLNTYLEKACTKNGIQFVEMPSYAGQDTGYIPARQKTMIFIPSKGGSHNPQESTKKDSIENGIDVFTDVAKELLLEKFKDTIKTDVQLSSGKKGTSTKSLEKEEEFSH